MLQCRDCGKGFRGEQALRTHQGKVHGSVLGRPGDRRKGPRWKRCTCACGFVHPPLRQIIGFRKVPLLDPDAKAGVTNPETGERIEIFDAMRSVDPQAFGIVDRPLSSSNVRFDGSRSYVVGRFQENFPHTSLPGVRCLCPRCGNLHIRRAS